CIARCGEDVLMVVEHVCLRSIRDLTNATMPQNVSVCRIKGDQVCGVIPGKQQPTSSCENSAQLPASCGWVLVAPHSFAGLVIDRDEMAAERSDVDFLLAAQSHRPAGVRFGQIIHRVAVVARNVKESRIW